MYLLHDALLHLHAIADSGSKPKGQGLIAAGVDGFICLLHHLEYKAELIAGSWQS